MFSNEISISQVTFTFEGDLIELTTNKSDLPPGVETFSLVSRMIFEGMMNQAFKDAGLLLMGYLVVFMYVFLMLGKFNCVQQRLWLSFGGIFGVTMGIVSSYGICSALGFFYRYILYCYALHDVHPCAVPRTQ